MIRFACAQCGKIHRIPDHFAGKRGKCGRCGLRFTAPGAIPTPSNVFIPVADDDDDQFRVSLRPRRAKPKDHARGPILMGLGFGAAMMLVLFASRDAIVSNVPGLAPLLPPPAIPAIPAVPAIPAPRFQPPAPVAVQVVPPEDVARFLTGLAHLALFFVTPFVLPATLSRQRYLSMGRWLIMAGFCFFLFVFGGVVYEVAVNRDPMQLTPSLGLAATYLATTSFFGIGGCLLAAAVYPKEPPPGRA